MSRYSYIGGDGLLPDGVEWDAAQVEKLLRDGYHIFLYRRLVARFEDGKYRVRMDDNYEIVAYETSSFLEFASWVAFYGCDYV